MKKENLFEVVKQPHSIISSKAYEETMNTVVLPRLEHCRRTFTKEAADGHSIYGEVYLQEKSRGSVMISHGFTESCVKYREMIYYFLEEGYSVCILDHRDHGSSRDVVREKPGDVPTHVEHFQSYVDDFDVVVRKVFQEMPKPWFLFAHSMGGAIGARYAQQHPEVFDKIVLNAPMLEINRGGIPYFAAKLAANVLCLVGRKRGFLPGQGRFTGVEDFENSPTTGRERYRYYLARQLENPALQSAGCSCRWAAEAFRADEQILKPAECRKIPVKVLLFQADKDDFVLSNGQDRFMGSIPKGRLLFVPGSKHEIYMSEDETLKIYLTALFGFLAD